MKKLLIALTAVLAACATTQGASTHHAEVSATAPHLVAAVTDARRPEMDTARDAARKPAETLAFIGIRPGMRVAELIPGTGYFARVFAVAVGPEGRVYEQIRPPQPNATNQPAILTLAAQYPNMQVVRQDFAAMRFPEPLDVVFTAQNYHDMHIAQYSFLGPVPDVNARAFEALKPGGVYIVLDHSAAAGSGLRDTETLHRIDQALVRQEVEAAGFVFDGESSVLSNPADTRTLGVTDPAIRAHTDQFILRFRKPAA